MRMISRIGLSVAAAIAPIALVAQVAASAPAAQRVVLKVGDMAPDFTLTGSTMKGVDKPVKLSSLRGKTVVLAFFPRARTGGCTIQMTAYRDQYESIFGSGKSATLFAISNDADTTQAAWAAEKSFPFTFLSDVNNDASKLYGANSASTNPRAGDARMLFIIGPDGKIAHANTRFLESDPTSYPALKEAIAAVNKGKQ